MAFDLIQNIGRINTEILEDIKIELAAQGHELTGKTANSLKPSVRFEGGTLVMEATASKVLEYLNDGVKNVSWKQLPFLIKYFKQRGLSDKEAKQAAAATIVVGMREGLPTKASRRFSETGKRTGSVEQVFVENKARYQQQVGNGLNLMMKELFGQVKSETI